MRATRMMAGLALLGTLLVPMQAEAQTTLTPDTWFAFSWNSAGTVSQQFAATTSTLLVVDCCIVGDMFEVFANGFSVGTTSSVAAGDGTQTGATTGAAAWADARLSKGMFTVAAGDLITITRIQQADNYPTGDGFVMSMTPTTVPEPATVVLLLSGLAGIAFVRTRRKDEIEG